MSPDGIDKSITRPKQIWTAIDCLGFLRGVAEDARSHGIPFPSLGGFGIISVASDLIIVAGEQNRGRPPTAALGHKQTLKIHQNTPLERLVCCRYRTLTAS